MRLKKDLEANGYSVWVDTDDICTGADWHSDIGTALQNCRALIAVLTANYLESHYCRKELFMASREKKPVFPIMLEEVDFKSSKEGAGVSLAVADLNWVMFSGKSYNKAFPKLLEGLHHGGVEPSLRDKHH